MKHCLWTYFSCFLFNVTNYDTSNTVRVDILSNLQIRNTSVTYLLLLVLSESLLFIYNSPAVQVCSFIFGAVVALTLASNYVKYNFIYFYFVGAVAVWCGLELGEQMYQPPPDGATGLLLPV